MPTVNVIEVPALIVDASIAVKWFSEEADTEVAQAVLVRTVQGITTIYAPNLLLYEVGNVLWKGKGLPEDLIVKAFQDLSASRINYLRLNSELIERSVTLMTRYNLTFYDAVYAGLASLLTLPLLTADPRHHSKVKEVQVLGLKDLKF